MRSRERRRDAKHLLLSLKLRTQDKERRWRAEETALLDTIALHINGLREKAKSKAAAAPELDKPPSEPSPVNTVTAGDTLEAAALTSLPPAVPEEVAAAATTPPTPMSPPMPMPSPVAEMPAASKGEDVDEEEDDMGEDHWFGDDDDGGGGGHNRPLDDDDDITYSSSDGVGAGGGDEEPVYHTYGAAATTPCSGVSGDVGDDAAAGAVVRTGSVREMARLFEARDASHRHLASCPTPMAPEAAPALSAAAPTATAPTAAAPTAAAPTAAAPAAAAPAAAAPPLASGNDTTAAPPSPPLDDWEAAMQAIAMGAQRQQPVTNTAAEEEEDGNDKDKEEEGEEEEDAVVMVLQEVKHRATASFDFTAQAPEDVSFAKGDELVDVDPDTPGGGWFTGTHVTSGRRGTFPSNYVEMTTKEQQQAEVKKQEKRLTRSIIGSMDAFAFQGVLEGSTDAV